MNEVQEQGAAYTVGTPAGEHPADARPVRLFRNGANQALRIPKEFELPGNDALIYREGARLIIEAAPRGPAKGTAAALLLALDEIAKLVPLDDPDFDPWADVDAGMLPLDDIDLGEAGDK